MVRSSVVLTSSLLIIWISVLGSTGSLTQGWRSAAKELSLQASVFSAWPAAAGGALSQVGGAGAAWMLLLARRARKNRATAGRMCARSWPASPAGPSTLVPQQRVQHGRRRRRRQQQQRQQQQTGCCGAGGSSEHSRPGRAGVSRALGWPAQSPPARGGGRIPPAPRPMSALLYHGRAAQTPTTNQPPAAPGKTPAAAAAAAAATTRPEARARMQHMGGVGSCPRRSHEAIGAAARSTSPAHWLPEPVAGQPAGGAQYRKRALALRRASGLPTRTLVAPEELTASAILPEEPNGITSMIAISAVLVFATLTAF